MRVLDLRVTARAAFRHLVRLFSAGPLVLHRPQDLRDDLARARHLDPIAFTNVPRGDQLGVVQRRIRHGNAADLDRLEHGIRVQRAGASYVDADLEQPGDLYLGREFARDGPARLAIADGAQLGPQRALIDFDGHAVRAVVEAGEEGLEFLDRLVRFPEVLHPSVMRLDRQPPLQQGLQQLVLGIDAEFLSGRFDLEGEHAQTTGARLFGIELSQRAGRGIARIGVRRLARLLALLIGLRKLALR